jgi:hypothetical protein
VTAEGRMFRSISRRRGESKNIERREEDREKKKRL